MNHGRTLCALACALVLSACALPAHALERVMEFGDNPAELAMYVYVPSAMPEGPRPLVVALHGCTQTAEQFTNAGWNDLADEWGFYVVYPEQNRTRNNQWGCFNWGGSWPGAPNPWVAGTTPLNVGELERGQSENQSIVQMVEHMKGSYEVDASRVFVTGLSAGGGMAAVLLATWPDVFAGGVIMAGIPYKCATERASSAEATACVGDMTATTAYLDRSGEEWASLVRGAFPSFGGPWPRVSIWHGSIDFTVKPKTSIELTEQWTAVHGIAATPSESEAVDGADHAIYRAADGTAVVETWTVNGMGHGAPVDPATGCGAVASWISDAGICAARESGIFLGLDRDGGSEGPTGDPGGPTVTITAPTTGEVVEGTVTVTVEAADPDGVMQVELLVDDVSVAMATAPPFTFSWDTTRVTDGARRLSAVALDATDAMGVGRSQVIVRNGEGTGTGSGAGTGSGSGSGAGAGSGSGGEGDGSFIAGCNVTPTGGPSLAWMVVPFALLTLARRRRS